MSRKQLAILLTIEDVDREGIFDVIGRMKVLLEFFKRIPRFHNLSPFLKTYYLITKSVAERSVERKGYFHNIERVHRLDVNFASLYFRPLKAFLLEDKLQRPWQTYFRYAEHKHGIPFVQMLLGINAHINADLLTSIVKLDYRERSDFLKINTVLREEIPDVMRFLAFVEHDLYGYGALIFKKFILEEFRHVIVKWRERAWENARIVNPQNYRRYAPQIFKQTEETGKRIIHVFEDLSKFRHVSQVVSSFNSLQVSLK